MMGRQPGLPTRSAPLRERTDHQRSAITADAFGTDNCTLQRSVFSAVLLQGVRASIRGWPGRCAPPTLRAL